MNSCGGKLLLPICRISSRSLFRYSFSSSEKKSPGNKCSSSIESTSNLREKLKKISADTLSVSSKTSRVLSAEELEWTENIEFSTSDKFVVEGRIRYTSSHEFIQINGSIGTVGITEHAARELGHVVSVDLPSIGEKFSEGDVFGSVKSINAVSKVHCPVAGEIIEVNTELLSAPASVSQSPLGLGWLVKLKLDSHSLRKAETTLLDKAAYNKALENVAIC